MATNWRGRLIERKQVLNIIGNEKLAPDVWPPINNIKIKKQTHLKV